MNRVINTSDHILSDWFLSFNNLQRTETLPEKVFLFKTSQNQIIIPCLLATVVPSANVFESVQECINVTQRLSPKFQSYRYTVTLNRENTEKNESCDPFPLNAHVNAEFWFEALTPLATASNSYVYFQRPLKPNRIYTLQLCPTWVYPSRCVYCAINSEVLTALTLGTCNWAVPSSKLSLVICYPDGNAEFSTLMLHSSPIMPPSKSLPSHHFRRPFQLIPCTRICAVETASWNNLNWWQALYNNEVRCYQNRASSAQYYEVQTQQLRMEATWRWQTLAQKGAKKITCFSQALQVIASGQV